MNNIWPKDWEVIELENVASAVSGCSYQLFDRPSEQMNEVITIAKFTAHSITLHDPKYMRISERELVKYRLRKGDIIFSHRNSVSQIGKSILFDRNETVLHTDKFIRIRPAEGYDSRFLEYVFSRSKDAGLFNEMTKQHANVRNVTLVQLKTLKVPFIALHRQKQFMEDLHSRYLESADYR